MSTELSKLEKKMLEVIYDDRQKVYSFHENYWTWEKNELGYLIVRKK